MLILFFAEQTLKYLQEDPMGWNMQRLYQNWQRHLECCQISPGDVMNYKIVREKRQYMYFLSFAKRWSRQLIMRKTVWPSFQGGLSSFSDPAWSGQGAGSIDYVGEASFSFVLTLHESKSIKQHRRTTHWLSSIYSQHIHWPYLL